MKGFCPRCFWISRRSKLPWQIFPGIFSSIDSYSKKVVHGQFDRSGMPGWLAPLGELKGYKDPPSAQRFRVPVEEHGLLLTGAPDAIFERADGTLVIADYKTSRYTQNQDRLFPMYRVQLNAYAYIARRLGWNAVSALALIYTEAGDHGRGGGRGLRVPGEDQGVAGLAPSPGLAAGFRQQLQSVLHPAGAARRPDPKARLGVILGNEYGGHFIEELGDALLARARQILQPLALAVGDADDQGCHVFLLKHSSGVTTARFSNFNSAPRKSRRLRVTIAWALPATASSTR
jgi:hypothetical protein